MGTRIDITGQRFGRLVALSPVEESFKTAKYQPRWVFQCDCGYVFTAQKSSAIQGNTQSCGCMRRDTTSKRCTKYPGNPAKNRTIRYYQAGAKRKGCLFELSREQCETLFVGDCFYCGAKPTNLTVCGRHRFFYNGIDRADNAQGYVVDNVVSCCSICNKAKRDLPLSTFLAWLKSVAAYN